MKTTIILFLILALIVLSACNQAVDTVDNKLAQPTEISEEDTLNEIESGLISETDDIEIGEMI